MYEWDFTFYLWNPFYGKVPYCLKIAPSFKFMIIQPFNSLVDLDLMMLSGGEFYFLDIILIHETQLPLRFTQIQGNFSIIIDKFSNINVLPVHLNAK